MNHAFAEDGREREWLRMRIIVSDAMNEPKTKSWWPIEAIATFDCRALGAMKR